MVRRPKKQPVTYVRRPRRKRQGEIFDLLAGLIVLLSLCLLSWFIYLFNFPNTALNPFPPLTPTLPPTITIPLATKALPATQTQAPVTDVPATQTPATLTPASASDPVTPSAEITLPGPSAVPVDDPTSLTETAQPKSYYSYTVIGVPPVTAIQASTLNPTRDCNWMGLGGNVFDIQNRPATGILVQMGGVLNRIRVLETSLSGTALQYGQAGYEFTLAKSPANSKHSMWVRLVDQTLQPLSQQIYFDTYENCGQNLILVNFKQVR
jgi:cytoskeletal protein RodZ